MGLQNNMDPRLLYLAQKNKKDIEKFLRWRPSVDKSYDDLIADIQSGNLSVNYVPENEWDAYATDKVGGWYSPSKMTIHIPDNEYGKEQALPHELMHYFARHQSKEDANKDSPGTGYGTPERINPYIKADMKLGGWLPSFHPGGRRPSLPGKTKLGQWWNEKLATKDSEYSNKRGYHPWFDEDAFDSALSDHGQEFARDGIDISEELSRRDPFGFGITVPISTDVDIDPLLVR
jgi:hypothetical protein